MIRKWDNFISGQAHTLAATIMLAMLRGVSALYCAAMLVRNAFFSFGLRKIAKAQRPVVSVGNITAGGTGKTPLVIELCRYVQSLGMNAAVLSRGYKAKDGLADEPAEIMLACPPMRVFVNSDRAEGAREAVDSVNPDLLILDDGFQHRKLHRNLDIVAIDATCPFGFGRVLPAGLLREPIAGLKRADICIITKCEGADQSTVAGIEERILQVSSGMPIAKCRQVLTLFVGLDGGARQIREIAGLKAFVFCGIGNPDAFKANIEKSGIVVSDCYFFPDHHRYADSDLRLILSKSQNYDIIIMTRKDYVKIEALADSDVFESFKAKAGYLELGIEFIEGQDKLHRLIDKLVENQGSRDV